MVMAMPDRSDHRRAQIELQAPRSDRSSSLLREHVLYGAMPKTRDDYLAMRRRYKPDRDRIKLVIIAESPPISGLYFYDPEGLPTEPLFAALMRQLGLSPATKHEGLQQFQRAGWILVDATYRPVNTRDLKRDQVIDEDYPLLRDDLLRLTPDRSVSVVLMKANVCQILESKLMEDRFKVINKGIVIPFPSHGQQGKFAERFSAVLKAA
jgi:hypothetical protein